MLQALKKYKYDILICIAIAVISIIEQVHRYLDFYWSGLRNSPGAIVLFILFIYEPLKILIILIAFFRIFLGSEQLEKLKRYNTTFILTILIFFGSWVLFLVLGHWFSGPVYFLNGYEKWVMKNVEIDKIQDWLVSGDADKYIPNYYMDNPPNDLPDSMKNFKRQYIKFNEQKSRRGKSIVLEWGGPPAHWGIVVGLPTSEIQQDEVIKESESYYEYRRSIKPGIYIYYGG